MQGPFQGSIWGTLRFKRLACNKPKDRVGFQKIWLSYKEKRFIYVVLRVTAAFFCSEKNSGCALQRQVTPLQ